ncbi:hypothetical protein B0H13DRAFT_1862811 [Mycena leptocephala]|nr:hypothetical protein B0H13DRAFT_1862811 [Mycena leptocephala]
MSLPASDSNGMKIHIIDRPSFAVHAWLNPFAQIGEQNHPLQVRKLGLPPVAVRGSRVPSEVFCARGPQEPMWHSTHEENWPHSIGSYRRPPTEWGRHSPSWMPENFGSDPPVTDQCCDGAEVLYEIRTANFGPSPVPVKKRDPRSDTRYTYTIAARGNARVTMAALQRSGPVWVGLFESGAEPLGGDFCPIMLKCPTGTFDRAHLSLAISLGKMLVK